MKGLQGEGAFSHFIKSGRAPSSGCSSKSLGLAVAPPRTAPHRTAPPRADKKREHYDSTRCSRMRARLPLHILLLHTQVSRWAHTYRGYASFSDICGERVCCLLVLDTVTSTPQCIRQPKPRGSAWFGFRSGFGIGFTLTLLLACAPLLLATLLSHTSLFPRVH